MTTHYSSMKTIIAESIKGILCDDARRFKYQKRNIARSNTLVITEMFNRDIFCNCYRWEYRKKIFGGNRFNFIHLISQITCFSLLLFFQLFDQKAMAVTM